MTDKPNPMTFVNQPNMDLLCAAISRGKERMAKKLLGVDIEVTTTARPKTEAEKEETA